MALILKLLPFSAGATEPEKRGRARALKRHAFVFSTGFLGPLTNPLLDGSPLWDAGDLHCGRSLPPGGKRFFEVQVDIVSEHHQAILELQDKKGWDSESLHKRGAEMREASGQLTECEVPHSSTLYVKTYWCGRSPLL